MRGNTHLSMPTLTLEAQWPESATVHTFRFSADRPVRYDAGQYAHFLIPSVLLSLGKPTRKFSFASAPNDPDIRITADISSHSAFKETLRSLKTGDTVSLYHVEGEMVLPDTAEGTYVFIAGGIGMTPFRSILRDVEQRKLPVTPVLVQVGHPPYLYEGEFRGKPFEQHRIGRTDVESTLQDVLSRHADSHYFIAGSSAFVRDTANLLERHGVPADQIRSDEFEGLKE